MCVRKRRHSLRGHGAQRVIGSRWAAHREEKPRALQIRELRELVQQFPLGPHSLRRSRSHELRVAHKGAQHNQPTLCQWFVTAPHVRPQLSDSGRRRTVSTAVHSRFALVGGYAASGLDDADNCVAGGACSLACCPNIQVVEERKKKKQAVRRMKGGGGFEKAPCCPSAKTVGASGSPCSQPSPWATPRQLPSLSHQH